MQRLLNEVINNALEIATEANDSELANEYGRIKKIISQTSYRNFNLEDLQTIWHLADIGDRTCDMLLEKATTPEQMEKTTEVQENYQSIKDHIEETVLTEKKRKGQISIVKKEKLEVE